MARNYPDLIEAWLEHSKHLQAPKIYQRWTFISMIAGALERRVWLMKNHQIGWYPNMFLFIVGPAGSGKSAVTEPATKLLMETGGIDLMPISMNISTFAKELEAIGKRKTFTFNGVAYPHAAATLFASEAASAFQKQYEGGDIIGTLTDIFNGGTFGWSLANEVAANRSTHSHGKQVIANPCVNVLACSTPDWLLSRVMSKNDANGGFGSRILLIVSKDRQKTDSNWEAVEDADTLMMRPKILEDLKAIRAMEGPYFTSLCFREEHKKIAAAYDTSVLRAVQTGIFGGYTERKMTHLHKLTMCIAAARRDEMVLKGEDLQTAWGLLNAIEPDMIETLNNLEMTPDAKLRRDMLAYLDRNDKAIVTKSELIREFWRNDYIQSLRAIDGLVAMGKLGVVEHAPTRTIYQVIRA